MRPTEWAPVLTALICRQHVPDMQAESTQSSARSTLPYTRTMSAVDVKAPTAGATASRRTRGAHAAPCGSAAAPNNTLAICAGQGVHRLRCALFLCAGTRGHRHRQCCHTEESARKLLFCQQGVTHAIAATQNSLLAVCVLITRFFNHGCWQGL